VRSIIPRSLRGLTISVNPDWPRRRAAATRPSQIDDPRLHRIDVCLCRERTIFVSALPAYTAYSAPFKHVFAPQTRLSLFAFRYTDMSTTIDIPLLSRPLDLASALKWTSLAVFVYVVVRLLLSGRRGSRLPPGPPTLPILGNIHQIPLERSFLQYPPDPSFACFRRANKVDLRSGRDSMDLCSRSRSVAGQLLFSQTAMQ
jgi:hypothetical protein